MTEKNKSSKRKKSFVFYTDWADMVDMLPTDEEAGALFKALLAFAADGTRADFTGALGMAFAFMSGQIARDAEKWTEVCEKRREGMRKRWAKNSAGDTEEYKSIDNYTQVYDTDTDTDTVNEPDNDTETVTDTDPVYGYEYESDTASAPKPPAPGAAGGAGCKTNYSAANAAHPHPHAPEKKDGGHFFPEREESRRPDVKKPYGRFGNVLLTDAEYDALKAQVPDTDGYIERLGEYIASKGVKYGSHYATILIWHRNDAAKKAPSPLGSSSGKNAGGHSESCSSSEDGRAVNAGQWRRLAELCRPEDINR